MGYFLTYEPENAPPLAVLASPKTHTPGARVSNLGYRFYSPNLGRWLSRDPKKEVASVADRDVETWGQTSGKDLLDCYPFVRNNSISATDALGLEVSVYYHVVQPPSPRRHTSVRMYVEDVCRFLELGGDMFQLEEDWSRFPFGNYRYITLGAGPEPPGALLPGGQVPLLKSDINRPTDLATSPNTLGVTIPPPAGMNNEQFIMALLQRDTVFSDTGLNYTLLVDETATPPQYNSNSYVAGLLESVIGAPPPDLPSMTFLSGLTLKPRYPGYRRPVPVGYFVVGPPAPPP